MIRTYSTTLLWWTLIGRVQWCQWGPIGRQEEAERFADSAKRTHWTLSDLPFIASLQFVKTRLVDHWLLSSFAFLNSKLNQLKLKYLLGTQVFRKHFSSRSQWSTSASMEHQKFKENLKSAQVFNSCHITGLFFYGSAFRSYESSHLGPNSITLQKCPFRNGNPFPGTCFWCRDNRSQAWLLETEHSSTAAGDMGYLGFF